MINITEELENFKKSEEAVLTAIADADKTTRITYDEIMKKILGKQPSDSIEATDYPYPNDKLRSIREVAQMRNFDLSGDETVIKDTVDAQNVEMEKIKAQIINLLKMKASIVNINTQNIETLGKDVTEQKAELAILEEKTKALQEQNDFLEEGLKTRLETYVDREGPIIGEMTKEIELLEEYLQDLEDHDKAYLEMDDIQNNLRNIAEYDRISKIPEENRTPDEQIIFHTYEGLANNRAEVNKKLDLAKNRPQVPAGLDNNYFLYDSAKLKDAIKNKKDERESRTSNLRENVKHIQDIKAFIRESGNQDYIDREKEIETNTAEIEKYRSTIPAKETELTNSKSRNEELKESLAKDIEKYTSGEFAKFKITPEDIDPVKAAEVKAKANPTYVAPNTQPQQQNSARPQNSQNQNQGVQGQNGTAAQAPKADPKVDAKQIKDKLTKLTPLEQKKYISREPIGDIALAVEALDEDGKKALRKNIKANSTSIRREDIKKLDTVVRGLKDQFDKKDPGRKFNVSDIISRSGKMKHSPLKTDAFVLNQLNGFVDFVNANRDSIPPEDLALIENNLLQVVKENMVTDSLSKGKMSILSGRKEKKERKVEIEKLTASLNQNSSDKSKADEAAKYASEKSAEKINEFYQVLTGQTYEAHENAMPEKATSTQTQSKDTHTR